MRRLFCIAVLALAIAATTASANVLALWEFNEQVPGTVTSLGGRIIDTSGNGRDLAVINQTIGGGTATPVFDEPCPWYGGGTGAALRFSNGGDALKFILGNDFGDGGPIASTSNIDFGITDSFTIEFVMRSRAANFGVTTNLPCPISKIQGGSTEPQWWMRIRQNGDIGFLVRDNSAKQPGGYVPTSFGNLHDGNWHHIAWVRDASASSQFRVYIDYQLVLTVADTTTSTLANTGNIIIGAFLNSTSRNWNGSIDFMKITGLALTTSQFVQADSMPVLAASPIPQDAAMDVPTSTNLSWTPIPGVTINAHTVVVSADNTFQNIVRTFNGVTGSSVSMTNMQKSRTYYWKVDTQGSDPNGAFYREGDTWSFSTEDMDPLLAGHWTFNQQSPGDLIDIGDKITDISVNNRNLYVVGDDEFLSGDASYGLPNAAFGPGASFYSLRRCQMLLEPGYKFFGDTAFSGSAIPLDADDSLTIEAVIKVTPDSAVFSSILSYLPEPEYNYWYGSSVPQYWLRVQDTGVLRFWLQNFGTETSLVTGTQFVRDGLWHHVAAVRDKAAGKIRIYVDGVLDVEGDDITTGIYPNGFLSIGGFDGYTSRNFNGNIDFVKVTRAALAPNEFEQEIPLPTIPDPVDGAQGVPPSYILSWTPAQGVSVISQTVIVATDQLMTNVVATVTATGNAAQVALDNNNTYYWLVRTESSTGTFDGNVWAFTTPMCLLTFEDGDINGDCIVDLLDFSVISANWLRSEFE